MKRPLLCAIALAGGLAAVQSGSAGAASESALGAEASIEITYVANEGFLISGAGRKVLIDAIFTEGWGRYFTPSAEILAQEQEARPPFDHIDALLVTHAHQDHFDPAGVMQHLIHGASAVLLGPPQVVDQLKALPDYSTVVKRVVPVPAEPGSAVESTVRGLVIRSGVLYHQADPQRKNQNFGFSFNLAGLRLLHVGDCDFDQITALKTLKPPGEAIDIAFLNCNWFDDPNFASARRMIDYIQPKAIVLMHVGVGEADSYRTLIGKMRDLPPVYLANSPMEKLKFRLVAGQLSVDHIPLQRETPLAAAPRP